MIKDKAFTLIELLVVIAIIGILSSVVLASLNSARENAGESKVKSNMANIRTQAAIVLASDGNYNGICNDSKIKEILNSIADVNNAITSSPSALVCKDTDQRASANTREGEAIDDGWIVTAKLQPDSSDSTDYWCVDSEGFSGPVSNSVVGVDSSGVCSEI